jgi:hypothetical protein
MKKKSSVKLFFILLGLFLVGVVFRLQSLELRSEKTKTTLPSANSVTTNFSNQTDGKSVRAIE